MEHSTILAVGLEEEWDDTLSVPDDSPYDPKAPEPETDTDSSTGSPIDHDLPDEDYFKYASDEELEHEFDNEWQEYWKYEGHMDEYRFLAGDVGRIVQATEGLDSALLLRLRDVL
ncbi:hypothetical protein HK097_004604 [Rhizophlyctis rosea]|uniref:Uncharacterized protein n=1 Tax=Rhizophlyctis rosea TaxID=64517 RepID=A0AAD5SJY7_9FUNG|nr:hypothetical protein HK097_004604 [Rhizophlyctis rosea]